MLLTDRQAALALFGMALFGCVLVYSSVRSGRLCAGVGVTVRRADYPGWFWALNILRIVVVVAALVRAATLPL